MDDWSPRFRRAAALDADRFTVAVGELEYDDPFTAILSYDERARQLWARVDVAREIEALAYVELGEPRGPVPIALSNEGDVYALLEGRNDRSQIAGAGIYGEEADGRGAVYGLLASGGDQYVLGRSKQFYHRAGLGEWHTLSLGTGRPAGYEQEDFGHAALRRHGSLVISSHQRPRRGGDFTNDPRYRDDMPDEELDALILEYVSPPKDTAPITRLYHLVGETLSAIDVPSDIFIRDVYVDPTGHVWIVGVDGLIMRGTPETGFERLDFHGDTETLHSATWFRDELILAWGYGLYRFDGHRVVPLKPKLNDPSINQNTPTPMKLQTVGEGDGAVMFYFDYKHGVCRWDGESWDWIEIPPELLEREFSGLPQ